MLGFATLILASGSPRRLSLLRQIGVNPDVVLPVTIDENPLKHERPRSMALRLATRKAEQARRHSESVDKGAAAYILAADTVVAIGRRIYTKALGPDDARVTLQKLSGRGHRVYTAIVLMTPTGKVVRRLVETRVHFKRLSRLEIDDYIRSGEWRDKAGAYAIQGIAGCFVSKLIGSHSNVVGLPLFETHNLLSGIGFPVSLGWYDQGGG